MLCNMKDGDTEKYHASSVIQDFVFWVGKGVYQVYFFAGI